MFVKLQEVSVSFMNCSSTFNKKNMGLCINSTDKTILLAILL